jgi:hypothetical protein
MGRLDVLRRSDESAHRVQQYGRTERRLQREKVTALRDERLLA